ncbi:MAG TPA: sugar kinase [Pseudonocardiaceae bacterium]|nr:sugar kinase [Pseudonocardiaceae bacterium]
MTGQVSDYDLVTVGESMTQLTPRAGDRLRSAELLEVHTAGAESNVAVQLARLGHRVCWISRVGADVFGDRLLAEFGSAGVDVSMVRRQDTHPTGVYFKDSDGQQTRVLYYRKGSAASTVEPKDVAPVLERARMVHLTGITPALSESCRDTVEHVLDRTHAAEVSFDVNHRPALWSHLDDAATGELLLSLAARADVVFVGRDEADRLWGTENAAAVRALLPKVPTLVVKDGDIGATSFGPAETVFSPAPTVDVVEPVGAGDAFAAGYLSARLRGLPEAARLRWGHLLAAVALLSTADQVELPSIGALTGLVELDEDGWRGLRLGTDFLGA